MSNRFVISNDSDSDSDDEPMTVNLAKRTAIAKQKPKPVLRDNNDEIFVCKTKEEIAKEKKLETTEENFPTLGSGKKNTPSIGAWGKKSNAHEYADTGVKATIKMPPAFKMSNKKKNDDMGIQIQSNHQYYDDESDAEFVDEEDEEDEEYYDDHEINPELGFRRKDGDIW